MQRPSAFRRGAWFGACLLILAGGLTYSNSLSGPLFFDDQSGILLNRQIRHLWPLSDPLMPPQMSPFEGRPLVNLSFAVNYAIDGLNVRGYHLANIALHILSALVLFGIIRRTLTSPRLSRSSFAGTPTPSAGSSGIALASALIWMLHPLQTEAVDYVTQRTELMMGLFYLLTLYCAIRAVGSPAQDRWHLVSILCCILGMACKESMVTAPVMVILYDRVFLFDSMKTALRTRKVLYGGLALTWLELAGLATSRSQTAGFSTGTSTWAYMLSQARMIVRYLKLTVWPRALVIDYGLPQPVRVTDVVPQVTLVIVLMAATALAFVVQPMIGFLGTWFFVTLAPTSSLVPIATEVGAERRMYLPLAGLVVLAVLGGNLLLDLVNRDRRLPAWLLPTSKTVAVVAVVAALAWGTARRNREYQSMVTIFRTAIERWPHGRAHLNLGIALKMQGNEDEAIAEMRRGVPDYLQARYELASELYDRTQYDEAIALLRQYLDGNPRLVGRKVAGRNLLALSLAQQRRLPEAVEQFQLALAMDPTNADLHNNLAFILLQERDFAGVSRHYEEYLKSRPATPFVLTNLGIACAGLGQLDRAIERFNQALAIDPHYSEARRQLAAAEEAKRAADLR